MKPTYEGFEAKKSSDFVTLPPVGAYVGEIQGVKTERSYDNTHDVIVLMVEITEGEYANQYHKVFEDQNNRWGNVKYKGTYRLTPPIEGDEPWKKKNFEEALWCVEQSNPGYHWDWDENKLKGKAIGLNVRKNIYTGKDGKQKEQTEIGRLETIEDVKAGKCRVLNDRVSAGSAPAEEPTNVTGTVEVPF